MMKKLLLSALTLGAFFSQAQIFSEDFSNGIPNTFTLINNDGLTPNAAVSYVNDAWVARTDAGTGNGYAASTSWYTPAGTSDDWMITPSITITNANTYLLWKAGAPDASFPDGYEVLISTTGTSMADFTVVYTNTGEGAPFVSRALDVSSYAGSNIYVAFRNNSNDMFLLFVDDIVVAEYPNADVAGNDIDVDKVYATNTNVNIEASFTNNGQSVTSATLNYSINGGTPVTTTLSGLSFNPTATETFSSATAWTPSAAGQYTIKAWLSNLNGGTADADNSNDTAMATVQVVANPPQRNVLAEEFSSSTCPPCKTWNDNVYNTALANYNKHSDKLVVKYQVPIPTAGDPSRNADSDARRAYYGVNSAPTMLVNGTEPDYDNIATWGDAAAAYADAETAGLAAPALASIVAYADVDGQGNTITVSINATVNPIVDMTSGDYRVQMIVLQKNYTFNGATNGDFEYHHVMRKMLPSPSGTTINAAAGGSQSFTESYTFNVGGVAAGNFNLWNDNLEVIVFVEDQNDMTISNAKQADLNIIGLSEAQTLEGVSIFPNPAHDKVGIDIANNTEDVTVEMVSTVGQVVYKGAFTSNESIVLETSNLEMGMYIVTVKAGGKVNTQRLAISH
jgi:hypothetical protein